MKWGHVPSDEDPLGLLIWALMFAIEDPYHSMGKNISDMFLLEGEIGGDPGWEIDHNNCEDGSEYFTVSVDPRVSGIKESNMDYSTEIVRKTTRQVLEAFANSNPEKINEVQEVLARHNL